MAVIHHAIYGDKSGSYALLKTTLSDTDLAKRICNVTDLLDRPAGDILAQPVFRAFAFNDSYLFIKSFPDETARRGRVLSHTLIMNLSDLPYLNDLNKLFSYFITKPDKDPELSTIAITDLSSVSLARIIAISREAKAINGLLDLSEYNNTLVWVGEEGYISFVSQVWPQLMENLRATIKLGVGFSPEKVDTQKLNILYVSQEYINRWSKHSYNIVDIEETGSLESMSSYLLAGYPVKSKPLNDFIKRFGIVPEGIEDLYYIETAVETFENLATSTNYNQLIVFCDLLSGYSPDPKIAKEDKYKLLTKVLSKIDQATIEQIISLKNVKWTGFYNSQNLIGDKITNWTAKNLLGTKFYKSKCATITAVFESENNGDWWKEAFTNGLKKALKNWKPIYAKALLNWFIESHVLFDLLVAYIPETKEVESHFVSAFQRKISISFADKLLSIAKNRNWLILHAVCVAKSKTPDKALESQLLIDRDENHSDGLKVISNYIDEIKFINFSLAHSENRLINISAELIISRPELLNNLDLTEQAWLDIWVASIYKGLEPFAGIKNPQKLTYELLDHLTEGGKVENILLEHISLSRFNDLSEYENRSRLWGLLTNSIKMNFAQATSCLSWLGKYLIISGIVGSEEEINTDLTDKEYVSQLITDKKKSANSLLGIFEEHSFDEELFLNFLSERYADFDIDLSRRVGKIIKENEWKKSYNIIKSKYAYRNSNLKVAVQICSDTFSFNLSLLFGKPKSKQLTKSPDSVEAEVREFSNSPKTILIVVASRLEAKMVIDQMKSKGHYPRPETMDKLVVWNLGVVNNNLLIMLKTTNMGSTGSGGSTLTVSDAIHQIRPHEAIMVGIAFGLNPDKQKIGDVLVSKQIEGYELSKIKEDKEIKRADKIPASISLVNRFENAGFNFDQFGLEFGLMISGEKLVDNKDFIQKLKETYPEAIGGEMEGEGFQSACHRDNIDWILIKGICDWGYNKDVETKETDQKLAINNVCDFCKQQLTMHRK